MDKKKLISWGVSFGSLALVSGMVSYLGLTNANKTNNMNLSQQVQATTAQSQTANNSYTPNNTTNNYVPAPTQTNSNHSANNNNIFSNVASFFDTTTGGS